MPNGYGLFDMAGNVWEWVLDDFDHQHLAWKSTSCPRDPVAQREGAEKVMRGGSFMCHKSYCWRSAARALAIPAVAAQTPPRSPFFTVPPDATTRTQTAFVGTYALCRTNGARSQLRAGVLLAMRPSQLGEPPLPTTYRPHSESTAALRGLTPRRTPLWLTSAFVVLAP